MNIKHRTVLNYSWIGNQLSSSPIARFASPGSLNKKCHRADKHFQMMVKRTAINYLHYCRTQELWCRRGRNTQSYMLLRHSRDNLFLHMLTDQQDTGARRQKDSQEISGVSSKQKGTACGKVLPDMKGLRAAEDTDTCLRLSEHSCIPGCIEKEDTVLTV